MTDFTITVRLDIEKDARNYRSAFNKNTHSFQRKDQVASTTTIDLSQLLGMKQEDAYPFLREYLEDFWDSHTEQTQQKIQEMQSQFNIHKKQIFAGMARLTKHPIYRDNFTVFLTSLNRWPYNYTQGYTWSHVTRKWYIKAFIHELLHFQTIRYYKNYIMKQLNDEKKFEDLKEALTFLLNYEFKDTIEWPDNGYPQHQELRKQLEDYRTSSEKDFEKLITYGCELLK